MAVRCALIVQPKVTQMTVWIQGSSCQLHHITSDQLHLSFFIFWRQGSSLQLHHITSDQLHLSFFIFWRQGSSRQLHQLSGPQGSAGPSKPVTMGTDTETERC
ncbi:hypothetical protein NL108_015838 [Boleophthalmus pectinirostris]|nr:hypothetical protein NL108_015838 [Boleophthalmus pectinirostris]